MKKFIAILILLHGISWANEEEGIFATLQWLETIDAGNYEHSWKMADAVFQQQLTAVQWQQALINARQPLGELVSRDVISTKRFTTLPGMPDGTYVVYQFTTRFSNKAEANETVTFSKHSGHWRALGYHIK